jgi:5'-nucleotidase
MRILLTNDDGIYSKGIEALYLALIEEHDVTVVAPETEQSAVGHAITWLDPLRVDTVHRNGSFFGYSLNGTPADCVKIAITELMQPPPRIVVSGINLGANVGVNVIYSGTVSAATEAAVLGIPSVAVSIESFQPEDFSAVTRFIPRLIEVIEREGLPEGVSLNVNVPNLPATDIRGVRITHQGKKKHLERYDRRIDPRGRAYYWLCNSTYTRDTDPAADSLALEEHYISVTPIQYDLTRYQMLGPMKQWQLW